MKNKKSEGKAEELIRQDIRCRHIVRSNIKIIIELRKINKYYLFKKGCFNPFD